MDYVIKQKEIGDYRITIYPDEWAECPVTSWDLAACYLFGYSRGDMISDNCDWKEVWGKHGDSRHTMEESIRELIYDHVDFNRFVKYVKDGKLDDTRLFYDRSLRVWRLEVYRYWSYSKDWDLMDDFEPSDFRDKDMYLFRNLFGYLGKDSLLELLIECGKDIHVSEWSTRGYSQGDYVEGIAFCTKERYDKMVGRTDIPWKEAVQKCIDAEVCGIGKWMWGDVLGYKLEKKVRFTKSYEDSEREDEDDFEWEDVDSCWGFYMDADDLIEEILAEHGIKEDAV